MTRKCEGCPYRGPSVGTKGDPASPFVVIGESPGVMEAKQGKPFVGPSGKLLHHIIPEEECYVINAFECFPGNRKDPLKTIQATKSCSCHLKELVSEYPREVILTLGNSALWSVTDNYDYKITRARGRRVESMYARRGIIPAIHPAALMRGTGSYRQFKRDCQYALHLARGGEDWNFIRPRFIQVKTDEQFEDFLAQFSRAEEITGDIESSGLDPREDEIITFGICTNEHFVYCFPVHMLPQLKGILEDPRIKWCWHNGKFDISFFRNLSKHFAGMSDIHARVDDDTMLMSYCQDENGGVHDLETVANDVLNTPDYKYMVQKYLPNKKASYANIPYRLLDDYMAIDVSTTHQVRKIYRENIHNDPVMEKLYSRTLIPASELLTDIEKRGFYVDKERVAENEEYYRELNLDYVRRLQDIAGYPINPGSPQQVADYLFNKEGLRRVKKDSTDAKVLEALAGHPFVDLLREHRISSKAYGTYVKPVLKNLGNDGRMHSTYLLHGTPTGRLASRNPNLQNIPRNKQLRGTYIAAPGMCLVRADLSQAELRSLALLSKDEEMCRIYSSPNLSLHVEVALAMFGEGYTKDQYVRAKAVNFGIVYGRTASTLAQEFKISLEEGQRMIDAWFERFPGAHDFIQKCRMAPQRLQTITTPFGRRKRHHVVCRNNLRDLRNEASNFPHQSIASDITLQAAIECRPHIEALGGGIVNLVHDEIITEVPDNPTTIASAVDILVTTMEGVPPKWGMTRIPFVSDPETGYRWGYTEAYEQKCAA